MGKGIGGDIVSVFIKRADGDTRNFSVASGGDNTRKLGGLHTEDIEMNGDGTGRPIMSVAAGERELVLKIDDRAKDQEWLVEASALSDFSTVSYTHTNGSVYSHKAKPTGDMFKNDRNATATVTFKGEPITQDA